jgi:hypothetical protein
MYNRKIETVEGAKAEHDANQRSIAIARLKKVNEKKHRIRKEKQQELDGK